MNKKCYLCDEPLTDENCFVLVIGEEAFDLCEYDFHRMKSYQERIEKRKKELEEVICCKNYGKNCEFDGVWLCKNPDCKTPVLTSTLAGAHPSGCPKIDKWNSKKAGEQKLKKSDEIKRLLTARNILHRLEDKGILENNLSTEQITAIRTAEYALDELCKSKDAQSVKREKWKEILYDAVEELEYYETHGDLLDRHIWKYKNEALALIGEDGEQNN